MKIIEKHIYNIPKNRDHQAVQRIIAQYNDSRGLLIDWAQKRLKTTSFNKNTLQYIYDRPQEWSGVTIVALAEYGIGIHSGMMLRSLCIRHAVDQNAALLIVPNKSLSSEGLKFTYRERKELSKGNATSVVDRIRVIVDKEHKDGELALYGPSQAAAILSAFAAHPDTTPNAMLTMVEPPHIQDRKRVHLGRDFLTSGAKLADNIVSNFERLEIPPRLRDEIIDGINIKSMTLYGVGGLAAQNRALTGIMRVNTAKRDIEAALQKDIPIVHAWGEHGALSGDEWNSEIAESIAPTTTYMPIRMLGKEADHSITNRYALNARLVHIGLDMLRSRE